MVAESTFLSSYAHKTTVLLLRSMKEQNENPSKIETIISLWLGSLPFSKASYSDYWLGAILKEDLYPVFLRLIENALQRYWQISDGLLEYAKADIHLEGLIVLVARMTKYYSKKQLPIPNIVKLYENYALNAISPLIKNRWLINVQEKDL